MARGAPGGGPLKWSAIRSLNHALKDLNRPGGPSVVERLACLPRLARAVARNEYTEVSPAHLALIGLAVAYVASPVDLVPEALLGVVGLADDAIVLGWLATTLVADTDAYLAWEQTRGRTIKGERVR